MSTLDAGPLLMLLVLGAAHGLNPGMGWLFAVALGLQERKGRAVWRALPALALGHALAIAAVLGAVALIGRALPLQQLRWAVAAVLLAFGVYKLFRHRHFRYGGMRVGSRDLTIWSFLMASGHGAGLMVLPFVLHGAAAHTEHAGHAAHGLPVTNAGTLLAGPPAEATTGLAITVVHTLGYLIVTGSLAWVVYEKVGLRLLRTRWINLDLVWAGALVATALATPWLG